MLVISRQDLSGLSARYAARGVTLDVLAPEEAEALLTWVIGNALASADAAGVAELAERDPERDAAWRRLCGLAIHRLGHTDKAPPRCHEAHLKQPSATVGRPVY